MFTGAQQIPALGFTPEHYYPIVTKLDLRPAVTATEQTTHWRNTPLTIDLAPLIDSRGNSPTATIVDQPTSGSLAQDGLTLTYTPTDSQFVGTDSFTVQAADEFYPAGPTVAIPIVYTNDSPIATSVGVNHSEDQTLNGMLNGSDANDDPLTFAITSQPDIGSVVLTDTTTGAFTYTPPANTSGTTSFAYTVSDGPSTVSATLTITVLPVNEAPDFTLIAEADIVAPETRTAFTQQHIASFTPGPANEASQTVLAYLVSVDRPDLFASQPAIDPSGLLTFTPSGTVSEASTATVTVQVQDNGGTANGGLDTSAAQTFTITIEPVADTLVVTTTADAGPGSLRDQLGLARSGDTITFDETTFHVDNSGAATVINILSPLPPLSHGGVTIDASDRKVSLNGSAAPAADGLVISSADNTVTGLTILAFTQNGIRLTGSAQGNVLGGTRAIGSGPNGQGLRIADCGGHGIHLDGPGVTDNIVEGCWVGLFASGLLTGPNLAGVVLENGANNNRIGSTEPDQGNVISGNTYEGIAVIGSGSSNNVIIGNLIGLTAVEEWLGDSWGHSVLGNGSAGIFLSLGTQNNRIGGLETGEGNAIYGSGGPGIEIRTAASAGNTALGNAISQNAGAGIGIFNGANDDVQPPTIITLGGDDEPELTNRSIGTDIKFLSGRTSKPSGVVQLFTDPGDEGEELIATVSVADGIWSASIPPIPTGRNLTATFTDELGNTSQFRSTNPGVFNRRIAVGLLDTDEEVQPVLDDHIAIPMVDGMATTPPVSRTEDHDIGFVPQPQSGG